MINYNSTVTTYINNEITLKYFRDIRKFKVLSFKEERELLVKIKTGSLSDSISARNKLICHNQRFVVSIAKHMRNHELFNDLISEGNLGLINAIEKYDINNGGRFITYACFWIRKYMNNFLIENNKIIRPMNVHRVYENVDKIKNELFIKNGYIPSELEVFHEINNRGVSIKNIEDLFEINIISLDSEKKLKENDKTSNLINSYYIRTSENNIDNFVNNDYNNKIINDIKSILSKKEVEIIFQLYGIGCNEVDIITLSKRMNMSVKTTKTIVQKALNKVRRKISKSWQK